VLVLMHDVSLHDSQVREYARSYMSAKIRWGSSKDQFKQGRYEIRVHLWRANNLSPRPD
jgi:hypothetical protein